MISLFISLTSNERIFAESLLIFNQLKEKYQSIFSRTVFAFENRLKKYLFEKHSKI